MYCPILSTILDCKPWTLKPLPYVLIPLLANKVSLCSFCESTLPRTSYFVEIFVCQSSVMQLNPCFCFKISLPLCMAAHANQQPLNYSVQQVAV